MSLLAKWLKSIGILIVLLLAIGYGLLWYIFATSSVTTHGTVDLNTGNIRFPTERRRVWTDRSALTDSLLLHWSQRKIKDWADDGKVTIPRILIGKLATGTEVPFVNKYIQEQQPRGTVGSKGPFHTSGDYDFTLAGLSLLLYSFGDHPEILYPETVNHIVDVLMTLEGGTPIVYTPRVLGFPLRDTENHILMTEGSRYLKNRWKALHGDRDPKYDNVINGLEHYVLEYLGEIRRAGYHEYNSRPYQGYTLTALLNLVSFASPAVRASATSLLDRTNWGYALGSVSFRRFPPFRRQPRRANDTDLDGDYISAMVKTWMSLGGIDDLYVRTGAHQALWVCLTPYRLPDTIAEWVVSKPTDYFIQMGHGTDGSPEIYSGGPGYLISSGGVQNDRFSQGVSRPTTLILDDGAMNLKEILHVAGPGNDYKGWNNTGVYENFAVAAGPVTVPETWAPVTGNNVWKIFKQGGLTIAVHSTDRFGVFCLFTDTLADKLLLELTDLNSALNLVQIFRWPDGSEIHYDVNAPKNKWVIVSINGSAVHRDHGTWPLMNGNLPGWDDAIP